MAPSSYTKKYWSSKPRSLNKSNKGATIEKFVDRRERSIKGFAQKKEQSIIITSAFNGAANICTALVHVGKLDPANFWTQHEKWFGEYVERLTIEHNREELTYEKVEDEVTDMASNVSDL